MSVTYRKISPNRYEVRVDGEPVGFVTRGFRHTCGCEWKAHARLPDGTTVRGWSWDRRHLAVSGMLDARREALEAS